MVTQTIKLRKNLILFALKGITLDLVKAFEKKQASFYRKQYWTIMKIRSQMDKMKKGI